MRAISAGYIRPYTYEAFARSSIIEFVQWWHVPKNRACNFTDVEISRYFQPSSLTSFLSIYIILLYIQLCFLSCFKPCSMSIYSYCFLLCFQVYSLPCFQLCFLTSFLSLYRLFCFICCFLRCSFYCPFLACFQPCFLLISNFCLFYCPGFCLFADHSVFCPITYLVFYQISALFSHMIFDLFYALFLILF